MGAGASRKKKPPRAELTGAVAVPVAFQRWKRKALNDRTDHELAEDILPSTAAAPPPAIMPSQVSL